MQIKKSFSFNAKETRGETNAKMCDQCAIKPSVPNQCAIKSQNAIKSLRRNFDMNAQQPTPTQPQAIKNEVFWWSGFVLYLICMRKGGWVQWCYFSQKVAKWVAKWVGAFWHSLKEKKRANVFRTHAKGEKQCRGKVAVESLISMVWPWKSPSIKTI